MLTEWRQQAFGKSSLAIGSMLKVGFSETPAPNIGASKPPLSPVSAGVAPALALKLKVAAMLETRVK